MAKLITGKRLAKNLIYSIAAQVLSLATSFVLNFLVPKFIDEYQYAYWQVFVLYISYVGILHFGLLDGIVLRYSQYDYEELDKPRIRSQFQLLLAFTSVITFCTCAISALFMKGTYWYIVILVAIGIITKNLFTYTSYTFQITNRINKYAITVIIQRGSYALFVIALLIFQVNDFYWYCIADLFGDLSAVVFGLFANKGMYFGKSLPIKETLKEAWQNVSSGVMLMVANLSSMLLTGAAKMIIQWHWDELVFGQVALSFSATNLFLNFVTAISVVLFPSLKRTKESELPGLYDKIRNVISPLLFFAIILYFPLCWILELWLPNYASSLSYLGILLPLIIYSSKVSLLTNNYLKAYRKERTMLVINTICVVLGIGSFALSAYVIDNLDLVLYCVVATIMLRSIVSEIAVMKLIQRNYVKDFIVELLMTIVFIAVARYLTLGWGCLVYSISLCAYFIFYRKSIAHLLKLLLGVIKRKKQLPTVQNANREQLAETSTLVQPADNIEDEQTEASSSKEKNINQEEK